MPICPLYITSFCCLELHSWLSHFFLGVSKTSRFRSLKKGSRYLWTSTRQPKNNSFLRKKMLLVFPKIPHKLTYLLLILLRIMAPKKDKSHINSLKLPLHNFVSASLGMYKQHYAIYLWWPRRYSLQLGKSRSAEKEEESTRSTMSLTVQSDSFSLHTCVRVAFTTIFQSSTKVGLKVIKFISRLNL